MFQFLKEPTRHLFFTGKGGVGKTSLATAGAIALADEGKRVLLVSTDPASNLGQVLDTRVDSQVLPVDSVPGLFSLNIDPEGAARAYRSRVLSPVRSELREEEFRKLEEQLSGACTTEIASFDEFTQLLTDPRHHRRFDHIVFDTAPTGHTLRLLALPAAWSSFITDNPEGASCLGPLSGLEAQRSQYEMAVKALSDPGSTTLTLVTRPEMAALREAHRSSVELKSLGIGNQRLVINGVFHATDPGDPLAAALEGEAREALSTLSDGLQALPREEVELRGYNPVGVEALRSLSPGHSTSLAAGGTMGSAGTREGGLRPAAQLATPTPGLKELVDEIEADGRGLVMTMGKGGVGKTTLAAAIALELARRGRDVHLSTTDPAAHLEATVGQEMDRLKVSRIDPAAETRKYVERIIAMRGRGLEEEGRRLLEEDLRSPCTEEVAVFQGFSRLIREAARGFVILDTAPTGHTLLLLDQTGAYHREVQRHARERPGRAITPLMRLQDSDYTKLLIVTLPETTPVQEAVQLQEDLRRAEIEPYAWIINRSLWAAEPTDPLLAKRAQAELEQIRAVRSVHAPRSHLVPWTAYAPEGKKGLDALMKGQVALEAPTAGTSQVTRG